MPATSLSQSSKPEPHTTVPATIHSPMKNIANKLGLVAEANENAILDALNRLEKRATDAEAALETARNEITDLKAAATEHDNAIKAAEAKAAEEFVDSQIAAGKFDAEQRESLLTAAKADFEGFKAMASAVPIPSGAPGKTGARKDDKGGKVSSLVCEGGVIRGHRDRGPQRPKSPAGRADPPRGGREDRQGIPGGLRETVRGAVRP